MDFSILLWQQEIYFGKRTMNLFLMRYTGILHQSLCSRSISNQLSNKPHLATKLQNWTSNLSQNGWGDLNFWHSSSGSKLSPLSLFPPLGQSWYRAINSIKDWLDVETKASLQSRSLSLIRVGKEADWVVIHNMSLSQVPCPPSPHRNVQTLSLCDLITACGKSESYSHKVIISYSGISFVLKLKKIEGLNKYCM